MTELTLKVDDDIALKFKEISEQKFHGDETVAFKFALKHLLVEEDRDMFRFEQIFEQIQDEIKSAGRVTDKEIDTLIAAYRQKKKARGK
ncbi:hypothetical protein H8E88_05195 [candidate division KSB1 bacterium]|nr:hypothetical protein [candidate division KSB1 bacterium]MBL7094472.1 hypothetical protein [candidate division KSB1 bacterium]